MPNAPFLPRCGPYCGCISTAASYRLITSPSDRVCRYTEAAKSRETYFRYIPHSISCCLDVLSLLGAVGHGTHRLSNGAIITPHVSRRSNLSIAVEPYNKDRLNVALFRLPRLDRRHRPVLVSRLRKVVIYPRPCILLIMEILIVCPWHHSNFDSIFRTLR